MSFDWVQLSMITVTCSGGDDTGLIFWLACRVKIVSVYTMKVYGGVEEYLRSLWISVLDREELSTTSCGSLPPVKKKNPIRVDYDSEQDPPRLDFMEKTKFFNSDGIQTAIHRLFSH
jgi:hypothetical protein